MEDVLKVTYYDKKYKKEETLRVFRDIRFADGYAVFDAFGQQFSIPVEQIVKIEMC